MLLTEARGCAPPAPQPAPNRRRTVLLFVFRDRTRTPLEKLIETWEADLQRMWDGIAKPPQYEQYGIKDFFELRVRRNTGGFQLQSVAGGPSC